MIDEDEASIRSELHDADIVEDTARSTTFVCCANQLTRSPSFRGRQETCLRVKLAALLEGT